MCSGCFILILGRCREAMGENRILDNNLHLEEAELQSDVKLPQFDIIITEEYLKALSYQKLLRENRKFYITGKLLYSLLCELLDHINRVFLRIRLPDVDIESENKTLIFLRKFSRSSELIKNKLALRVAQKDNEISKEVFEFGIAGIENQIGFIKGSDGVNRMVIRIPSSYVYNRMISFVDKMNFSELPAIEKNTKAAFLTRFQELSRNVEDKKQQIDMKYALELATDRIQKLEEENSRQMTRIQMLQTQNELYKRSYLSLRKRQGKNASQEEDSTLTELKSVD